MSQHIRSQMTEQLAALRSADQYRMIPELDFGADLFVHKNGQKLLNLGSNNYLGLSGRNELRENAVLAVRTYGTTSGASRLVTGTFGIYDELEHRLAQFKEQESALVLNTGLTANITLLSALADRNTLVFSDRLNHASIIDGITLSGGKHVRYRHNDIDHLTYCLEKYRSHPKKILVTDTIFSMDGDRADLPAIVRLCKEHDVFTIVDEAHAAGVYGQGRGLAHEYGLAREIDLHMGTFSKAFGSFGAYVAGDTAITDYLKNVGRGFIFTTALPPAVIGANIAALEMVNAHPELGMHLQMLSEQVRSHLKQLGFSLGDSTTQIIPVILGDNATTLAARDFLLEKGILVGAIRPPTVPAGTARLRLSLRADLTDDMVTKICDAFTALANRVIR